MVRTKDQKKALIQEVLVVETNQTLLETMINKQLTIYEYFAQLQNYRIGKIANKTFEAEPIDWMELIEDRFPKANVFVDLTEKTS